jgi:HEAT repeat protein
MPLFGPPDVGKLQAKRDVTGLIKALGYQKDLHVGAAAAHALGQIGDPRTVEPLIGALKDPNDVLRRHAADALGQIGDPRAVEPLIIFLQDNDKYVRCAAAWALGQIGDPRAVEPLIGALKDPNDVLRDASAEALGKIGDARAVEPLIAALPNWAAINALGKIGDARAIEPLIGALKDPNHEVRRAAVRALGQMGAPGVEPLIAALKDQHDDLRKAAVQALGKMGAPAVEPLIAALRDQDWHVRNYAVEAIVQIGAPAVQPLIAALKDEDKNVRPAAAGALDRLAWSPDDGEAGAVYWAVKGQWGKCVEIGAPAVEPLIAVLRDRGWGGRRAAAEALGQIGDARAVEPLIAALQNLDWDVRQAAAVALGQIGDPRAVEPLIAVLKDQHGNVRTAAAEALHRLAWSPDSGAAGAAYWAAKGEWGKCVEIGAPAVEPLIAALKDEDNNVRQAAAGALSQIGDARAVEPLIAALQSRGWGGGGRAAAAALGQIGDARAVGPLIAALQSLDWDVRQAAVVALDRLAWSPDSGAAGAAYWAAKGEWGKCVEIGAAAVKPLIATLKGENWDARKAAAEGLVAIYRLGKLDETQNATLLAQQGAITRAHRDHEDNSWAVCNSHTDGHTDEGIGVEFPI